MHRRLLPVPLDEAWPAPEELISRRELSKLLGIKEECIRGWERAGLMPPRAPVQPEGILKGLPRVLWRGSDLQEWRERMIGIILKRPPKPRGRKMEWVQGRGWVDLPLPPSPPSVDPARRAPSAAKHPRRSSKIPGRHLTLLTRLEGQLAWLQPDDEQEPVEEPQPPPPRPKEPEPIPFASNIGRPRARSAGYW